MSTQIVYTENVTGGISSTLNWPSQYVDPSGVTRRMPNPSIPIKYGYRTNSLLLEFESGHEQRREKGMTRKTFEFTYNVLYAGAAKALENFFLQCRGQVRAFNWTDPATKESYVCRFDSDSFMREYFAHSAQGPLYRVTVKLVQVV